MLKKIINCIDSFQNWFGYLVAMLIFPLCLIMVYEVVMRYIFNKPTSWGFELTTYIYGIHFMLALGYTFLYNTHVRVEVLVSLLSQRKQTIISLICHLLLLLPVFGLLAAYSMEYAYDSITSTEHSWSAWGPAIYPYKTLMALGFVMFFIQGISSVLKHIVALRNNE